MKDVITAANHQFKTSENGIRDKVPEGPKVCRCINIPD